LVRMKATKILKIAPTLLTFLFILFCFSSCSMRAEQKSLTAGFETIDSLILQNQFKAASKQLKKIEKKLYDSWSYIGVFKRYSQLQEFDNAERIIKTALEKNSNNLELLAVYSKFLSQNNRLSEAEKYGIKLKNTKYGSIYSEIILKQSLEVKTDSDRFDFYQTQNFYDIFMDAYLGTRNPIWLKNCSVYYLHQGMYEEAVKLNPDAYPDADDAYFWALVFYDAAHYYDAIDTIETSKKILANYKNKNLFKVTEIAQVSLEADSYMSISDFAGAEGVRKEINSKLDSIEIRESDKPLLPVIMLNSAIWAQSQNQNDDTVDLLFGLVTRYPDFVPGLILYSEFAYNSKLDRNEDTEVKALRTAGITSLEMEEYDNRRKIPVSDAIYRLEEALKKENNPYLEIEKLDLQYKMNKSISTKEKTRNLWNLLENNYIEGEKYKELLVQYAVNFLLKTRQSEDAWNLFNSYVFDKYNFNADEDFFDQFAEKVEEINLPLAEFGGYFAAAKQKLSQALRIYEFCVFESSGITATKEISTRVTTPCCLNLADIYFANAEKTKALELYGKAAGRETDKSLRSEIYYRIANIYVSTGDTKAALRSVDYACSINPENEKAALLRRKLSI